MAAPPRGDFGFALPLDLGQLKIFKLFRPFFTGLGAARQVFGEALIL
jgi:hypothetical protein